MLREEDIGGGGGGVWGCVVVIHPPPIKATNDITKRKSGVGKTKEGGGCAWKEAKLRGCWISSLGEKNKKEKKGKIERKERKEERKGKKKENKEVEEEEKRKETKPASCSGWTWTGSEQNCAMRGRCLPTSVLFYALGPRNGLRVSFGFQENLYVVLFVCDGGTVKDRVYEFPRPPRPSTGSRN